MKNYDLTEEEKEFVLKMIDFLNKKDCDSQVRYWCKRLGHPRGPVWYNYSGFEPDMHCIDCGEDLG